MKTANQARQCYMKKARKTIKKGISTAIKRGRCHTPINFDEESFKLAEDHAWWLASMGYKCTLNEIHLKMHVSWA